MNQDIDFQRIARNLDPETLVPQWLPGGRRAGSEYVVRNPRRADENPGSFSINMRTGAWADFAADVYGGDLISLYAYLHGCNNAEAARQLGEAHASMPNIEQDTTQKPVRDIDDVKPTPIIPAPLNVTDPSFKHYQFGEPSCVWHYRNADGRTLLYVCRFETSNGKELRPLTWCSHPKRDGQRWEWRGITKGKVPLYGLDRLAAKPDVPVIVVEGEKTADAAQELFPKYVVVTWLGGCGKASIADVKELHGRDVILWPDFDAQREKLTAEEKAAGMSPSDKPYLNVCDQPGVKAMREIWTNLREKTRVQAVAYRPGEYDAGSDLADGWSATQAQQYLQFNTGEPSDVFTGKFRRSGEAAVAPGILPMCSSIDPMSWVDADQKLKPQNTIANIAHVMTTYGIKAKYNEVKKNVELVFPGREHFSDLRADAALSELISLCNKNRCPSSQVQPFVKVIASDNSYSPVRDWIDCEAWDGVERIPALLTTIHTEKQHTALKDKLIYRWLISAVAAAYRATDFESHGVLVLAGAQGEGKTTWFRRLAPTELGLIMVGASVDPTDKDSVTRAVSHWIVELGELEGTFRKSDMSRLKAFVTQPVDKIRRPYDRIESDYKRTTVFGASVNDKQYLVDESGNRRWWTVPVVKIDYRHEINMQQVWAEVHSHYARGERWVLDRDEQNMLNDLNSSHETTDPISEQILRRFDFERNGEPGGCQMTATEVLQWCGYPKPTKQEATRASKVLRDLTGMEPTKTKTGRVFMLPRRIGERRSDATSVI